ncbi:MAG: DEAD/DEAH box helicase [Agathobacter sp.]|nr:DEAD/DEAH box helicase [Agathobacter sp.]
MWENLFTKTILNRGLELYARGNCTILDDSELSAYVQVRSESRRNYFYDVDFDFEPQSGTFEMTCDCPYAEGGYYCKHMAAAIYELKNNGIYEHEFEQERKELIQKQLQRGAGSGQQEANRASLFEERVADYQYYSMPSIVADTFFSEQVVKDARLLANKKQVTIEEVSTGYWNNSADSSQVCHVAGTFHQTNGYLYNLSFLMNRSEILQMECGVPGCSCHYDKSNYFYTYHRQKTACKHIAALMIAMDAYQKEHTVGDATDRMGMQMLDLFRTIHAKEEAKKEQVKQVVANVQLQPRLILEDEQFKLSFKIGDDKLYVIKSIKDFVQKYENKDTLLLGKTKQINLATAQFSEEGEQYLDFITREVKQELDHKRKLEANSRSWYAPEVKAEGMGNFLYLYGTRLDDFFDIAEGGNIAFTDKDAAGRETPTKLTKGSTSIVLTLSAEKEERQFQSIRMTGTLPALVDGSRYKYFVDDEKHEICRLDEETMTKLAPLLKLARFNKIDLNIGRRNIPEFYYRILPYLRKCAVIDDRVGDEVNEFLPRNVDFLFYLDAEKDRMNCRPVARYEDQTFSVLDYWEQNPSVDAFRDRLREIEAGQRAMSYFPERGSEEESDLLISQGDEEAAYRILDEGVSALMELGEVHCTDRFKSRNIRRSVKISVGVSVKSEIMDLEISSDNLSTQELLEILNSYRLKKKYHRLKNGDFVDITDESIAELSSMMDTMHISPKEFAEGKMHLPLYRAIYLDKMLESCQEIYASRDHYFRNLVKDFKTVGDSDYELPDNLKKVLRNYQKYGYKWLRVLAENHFGGILADDMGLGKTAQIISVLLATHKESGRPSLIVCPASLVYNWQAEFDKFAPEMTTLVIVGTQGERKALLTRVKNEIFAHPEVAAQTDTAAQSAATLPYDVLITSYDLLKRDIAEYEDMRFEYQIIDEAQYIKTHTTAAAKAVKVIQANHRFALTGTPIENRLSELWSIFDYLMPGFLYSYDVFKKELETPIVKTKDEEATKRLKRMVSPFILRRLKKDVLKDLPDKMEELQYAHMEAGQQQLYDAQVAHMKDMLGRQDEESFKKNKIQILAELMRIRQICCDPSLMIDNYKGESAKRIACLDLIESAIEGEHKMLIFSQFTTMLELLAKDLTDRGISYYMITGATSKEKRVQMVNEFNTNEVPVFLISLKAGGTGLNLTGADVVIHYDPWWNVAAQNQATDRAHRIGQTKVVSVYKLIVKNSIEEKIVKMQQEKADLADAILNGENGNVVNMSKDDLLQLLSE